LPPTAWGQGDYKVAVQPYYFTGAWSDSNIPGSPDNGSGNFHGTGAAASLTYGLADRWALWTMLYGARLTGDYMFMNPTYGNFVNVALQGNVTTEISASPAVVYRFIGDSPDHFILSGLLGPNVTYFDSSQRVYVSGGASGEAEDFNMATSKTFFGLQGALQASIPVGKGFSADPYLFFLHNAGFTAASRVTSVAYYNKPVATSEGCDFLAGCDLNLAMGQTDTFFPGVNITYRPWSLSVNIASYILHHGIYFGKNSGPAVNTTVHSFSVAWSFGNSSKKD
jgi:hypothetical protein